MRVALALCLLAGCDFIFRIDRVSHVRDGSLVDGSDGMVQPDAPQTMSCNPSNVTQLVTGAGYGGPSQSSDGLQLFMTFFVSAEGHHDIHVATRSSVALPFATPMLVAELSSQTDDLDPNVWGGGTRILWTSSRSGTRSLWQGARSLDSGSFTVLAPIGTSGMFGGFDVTTDGLTLYADDGLNNALKKATRQTESEAFGSFGTLYNGVGAPSLTANQLVIYYHRTGVIYRAQRSSTVGGFSGEEAVIAGSDPDISADGKTLAFKNATGIAAIECWP